ncbi:7TM domain-containing protein [Erythrobacter sp. R86502]|uniref:7TM domain-containing protein n=1 Tax=Erythrobacter sp. R86502 TaxID=3093846 RepID=UPI0036D2AEBD
MPSRLLIPFQRFWRRATPQIRRPIYIGAVVGLCLAALVGVGLANTASFFALPSSFEGVATSQAIWGLKPDNLLMVLPLGAFLVVLARSFIGLKAFGLFTPMLIALAFLQIGPVMGPVVLVSSVLTGMIVTPTLLKLRMTRVGFLGVLISLIVLVLVALQMILDTELQVDAFPVIVCALCVERWWKQWAKDGAKPAAKMALNTFVLAVVIEFVMVSNFALALIETSPLLMPGATGIAIAILGRYRGLRLTEIGRFAPIWLERRRKARVAVLPEGVTQDRRQRQPDTRRVPPRPSVAPVLPEQVPLMPGMWVIRSPADFAHQARRHACRDDLPVVPNMAAQFAPTIDPAAALVPEWQPPLHNAWVIRKAEDV